MIDLGTCAVQDCAVDAAVDHGAFALCTAHEGRRLAGYTFSLRRKLAYGGAVVTVVVFR